MYQSLLERVNRLHPVLINHVSEEQARMQIIDDMANVNEQWQRLIQGLQTLQAR